MHTRNRGRAVHNTAVLMAGWLFADLMLVLFVVGLGSQPTAYPAPLPTVAAPSPTPTPTPTKPPALAKDSVIIQVSVDFGDLLGTGSERERAIAELREQVVTELDNRNLSNDRAGMVLVWTYHDDVDYSQRVSQAVAEQLSSFNRTFFDDSTMRPFWRGARAAQSSRVDLEIYVLK